MASTDHPPEAGQNFKLLEYLTQQNIQMSIVITIAVAFITISVVLFFGIWKYKSKVLPSQSEARERKYRFRKRDKVIFYGRKMLRKVRSFTRNTMGTGTGVLGRRKSTQKLMLSRLKKLVGDVDKKLLKLPEIFLQKRDPSLPQLKKKAPPSKFLEADWSDFEESDPRIPPEIFYLLRSVRVFGHLEKPFFLELCKFMESVKVQAGDYLFRVGDVDNCIYVVQSGLVEVFVKEKDGDEHLVKVVSTGDSIHSLLSILDVLTGHPVPYKSVSAKAVVDSIILKLPAIAFSSMFERFSESVVRMVQIIMIRLQRVTFMALHNYLGLSNELINNDFHSDVRVLHISALSRMNTPSSPLKAGTSKGTNPSSQDAEINSLMRLKSAEEETEKLNNMSDFNTALMRARVAEAGEDTKTSTLVRQVSAEETSSGVRGKYRRQPQATEPMLDLTGNVQTMTDEVILELARKDITELLGLKNPKLLDGKLSLQYVKAGKLLCKQGDQDVDLYFVVKGSLHVLQQLVGESAKEVKLYSAQPGEMVGMLAVLTGEPSFFTTRTKSDVILAVITKTDFYSIMREEPFIVLNTGRMTVRRMSAFVRQIDFALDWHMVEVGKALYRQGDKSDSVYIVLTGRLRSVITLVGGKKELVGEYGRGELVGIVEVLTHTERATTVLAVRDTEVAKIPEELLTLIKMKYPQVVTRLIHLLGQRILGTLQNRNTVTLGHSLGSRAGSSAVENVSMVTNLATVAVLPVSENVPVQSFTMELQHALNAIGPTTRLSSEIIKTRLGASALDGVNEFRLSAWLNQQEDINRMVLYQCDYTATKWTKHCIRQADAILIVAVAESGPVVGEIEKELENIAVRAQKELIILHREDAETPRRTAEWLNAREWCCSHHHIRCNKRVFSRKPPAKMLQIYEKLFETEADRMSDFSRLARFLTGTSIGVVLGGGGARGLAHIGMVKAMQEVGIPIDMVGGTSMGSFIGALWAEERSYPRFSQRAREWCFKMTSVWRKVLDLTYPYTSMFTGGALNEEIECMFHDRQIEDLWIPYFCVTTDISNPSMRIHTSGSLWRYVRASMSLSGYLPPLCDPSDGHLLLDGGYVNNLPADIMHTMGAQTVFAIDVGAQDEVNLTNYGDKLSGWWLLWNRWNPWGSTVKVPDMTEIQSRLAYVSCTRQLEIVKNSDYCEYIRPPIDKYGTLQFGACDEIMDVGYNHGKTLFSGWTKGGLVEKLFKENKLEKSPSTQRAQQAPVPVMAYFTDLAELVSKIEKPQSHFYLDTESDLTDDDGHNSAKDDEYIYDDAIILEEGETDETEEEEIDAYDPETEKPTEVRSDSAVTDVFIASSDSVAEEPGS
ncbi:neuropathy target esterase-like isoform X2 [Pomacea canaliculata]|uniref:neuropathy target esterase-like isoform X2 n=1 Tax=Pomacea canaliculata TaxID=400727 RepID=UPI000D72B2B0|nr:neuropathy target esterase-like isoform X2 [Pomacea canaliculata]